MAQFSYLCVFPVLYEPDSNWEIAEINVRAMIDMDDGDWSIASIEISGMRTAASGRLEERWIDLQPGSPRHTEIKAWMEATRGDDIQAAWLDEDVVTVRGTWADEHRLSAAQLGV